MDDFDLAMNSQMEAPQLASLELAGCVGAEQLELKKKQSLVEEKPKRREVIQLECKSTEDLMERQMHNQKGLQNVLLDSDQ